MRAYGPVPLPPPKRGKEGTRTREGQRSLERAAQRVDRRQSNGTEHPDQDTRRADDPPTTPEQPCPAPGQRRQARPTTAAAHAPGSPSRRNPFGRLCQRTRTGSLGHIHQDEHHPSQEESEQRKWLAISHGIAIRRNGSAMTGQLQTAFQVLPSIAVRPALSRRIAVLISRVARSHRSRKGSKTDT
jgi:hypothetical protein